MPQRQDFRFKAFKACQGFFNCRRPRLLRITSVDQCLFRNAGDIVKQLSYFRLQPVAAFLHAGKDVTLYARAVDFKQMPDKLRGARVDDAMHATRAAVEEGADYLKITPPAGIRHAAIDTYDDHRMAMCFSLSAFGGAGGRINDPRCVAKTFPEYFTEFAKVTASVPVIAIDGPSASGKGTVAQRVAAVLGFHFLDSGALYRLLGLAA